MSPKQKKHIRYLLQRAVAAGTILKPICCSECREPKSVIDGHHEDYDKPLEVVWICRKCHKRRHRIKKGRKMQAGVTFRGTLLPSLDQAVEDTAGLFRQTNIIEEHEYFDTPVAWTELFRVLTSRQRIVMRLRYGFADGVSHSRRAIAKMMGISHQAVNYNEQRAIEHLKRTFVA